MIHPPLTRSIPTLILVVAFVLLTEAIFVMSSGWSFHESILGGRIRFGTVILLLAQLLISRALIAKYAFFPKARRVALTICTVVFAVIACGISIEFTWSQP
jgi:hypothetical protein